MRSKEYLEEIRKAEGLSRAVLKKIEADGTDVVFFLITDKTYSAEDVAYARGVSARYVPQGFSADVKVMKSVPSAEAVRAAILEILRKEFPAVAAFTAPERIAVEAGAGGGSFRVRTASPVREETAERLRSELAKRFCGNWTGDFVAEETPVGEIEREAPPPEEFLAAPRFFSVEGYEPIDGAAPVRAVYIADLSKEMKNVTVCGAVVYIEERETKKGKPYFALTVSDGTGQMRVSYFTKKTTLDRIRALKAGDWVCLTGDNEIYNGGLSFRVKQIDLGRQPADFTPEARPSRPVPLRYQAVFPSPESDPVQADLFGAITLPEEFGRSDYVVFDLETTGLNNTGSSGMDRIIEIGAVKISGGKISEKFSSFVACPVRLSEEIVGITGITDDMLKGAPDIKAVIADFFKFSAGCALVGHNVQFDYKFIRYYGEKEGYLFEQRQYDTVSFAQELLRLSNYKLNTVADYFGFAFHHHRAYDDAFVTAKIFIELVRRKGGLPK